MREKFWFHTDSGHGWLAVKRAEAHELMILDKVSTCSYQKGKTVYLEEDCDAELFINAYKQRYGVDVKLLERNKSYTNSPIRAYELFKM